MKTQLINNSCFQSVREIFSRRTKLTMKFGAVEQQQQRLTIKADFLCSCSYRAKKMITLKQKTEKHVTKEASSSSRISIRDKLLVREVQELEQNLPKTCEVDFSNPNQLHLFTLKISPDEGYWMGGTFVFVIEVPEEYNIVPPKVHCQTRIWHPNINEEGEVCLSLLRQNSFDSLGWAPTRKLIDVVWGLNSLFNDLLNFDDPLNFEAAEHFEQDKAAFISKVKDYVCRYAKL